MEHRGQTSRPIDGLTNPKIYHRPLPPKRRFKVKQILSLAAIGLVLVLAVAPTVRSFSRQYEVLELLTNGRYLVLFQNDAEIRSSGGFIGSYAVIEAKDRTIKPLHFETNPYKLDNPASQLNYIEPPPPLKTVLSDQGWGMRDANFAADFRQSAPTVSWFFEQEARRITGPKKAEIEHDLGGDYHVDGVIGITLSAFLDIIKETGPITIPEQNITVDSNNFFQTIQQIVEKDYFNDPQNKITNEPKTVLKNLFPLAMNKAQNLPKTTLYKLASKLLNEKKIVIYTSRVDQEKVLVDQGWAGALELPSDQQPKGNADFLAVVRNSYGGNKSSLEINPVYHYTLNRINQSTAQAKLEITFEHTGNGQWPSGVNHEYLRILGPGEAELTSAKRNGETITNEIDIGHEEQYRAFGFWIHTEPQSSQTVTIEYKIPIEKIYNEGLGKPGYQLVLYRQPGGNSPDITVTTDNKVLYQGRLIQDRVIAR